MPEADIYLSRINVCRYWPANVEISCKDCLDRLAAGKGKLEDCTFLESGRLRALKLALEPGPYLPSVPQLTVPQPMASGLFPLNEPNESSLVIVTGNNRLTFELLATVWAQGVTPAYFLLVDCLGNTVDMAMVYREFTPARLAQVLKASGLETRVKHRHMIVPGLTASLAEDFAAATNWEVEVGPVCAVELPLFLGERWRFSAG
jgi:hypothetical protein